MTLTPFMTFSNYVLAACLAVALLVVTFNPLWRALRSYLVAKYCCVDEIKNLGTQRPDGAKIRGTAVVCGGSYAGLFTARTLHDHFERVILIEPEEWLLGKDARRVHSWEQESKRSRVIQYMSLQGTQPLLLNALRFMFPGWDTTCKESGIEIAPSSFKFMYWGKSPVEPKTHFGGSLPNTMYASRRGLETALRRRVLDPKAYPNIVQIAGSVTGFIVDPRFPDKVAGVKYASRDPESGTPTREILAELVVDCTGPAKGGLSWLPHAGFLEPVKMDTYDAKMRYTTFTFHVTPELAARLPVPGGFYREGGGFVTNHPDSRVDNKYIGILRNEGDLLYVCAGGWGRSGQSPKTIEDVIAHCQSLKLEKPFPQWALDMLYVLQEVEQDAVVSHVNVGPSFLMKFHECNGLPTNFVALGDAVCRVNPLYGQGCAKAVIGATCLNTVLNRTRSSPTLSHSFGHNFFKLQAMKLQPLWNLPILIDYGQQSTIPVEGEKKSSTDFARWYLRQIQKLSFTDESAYLPMYLAANLLGSTPIDMFHPLLVAKVMWQCIVGEAAS
ncbi:hypothetical protein CYLTODRAFT_442013 [Cylindrobasidium torrendii FP15055 ss-10]|uniref:FAD/NAD(P)-binding domain-containing protein n=1 Tax=Cylindrobasidium torrendii FP15055 ss-10 TaxID=1314674 RepID=A0A0D7BIR8_9AGAR|nr:hypothetical protein CYLTODRAFT_442013 [Cylindrobasidium torrendii FP15055 ss-10]